MMNFNIEQLRQKVKLALAFIAIVIIAVFLLEKTKHEDYNDNVPDNYNEEIICERQEEFIIDVKQEEPNNVMKQMSEEINELF